MRGPSKNIQVDVIGKDDRDIPKPYIIPKHHGIALLFLGGGGGGGRGKGSPSAPVQLEIAENVPRRRSPALSFGIDQARTI